MNGATQYGEDYRAVLMVSEHTEQKIRVEILRRYPDQEAVVSHTISEEVAHQYTTLQEAVAMALDLRRQGHKVKVDHMPDGRGGDGHRRLLLSPAVLDSILSAIGPGWVDAQVPPSVQEARNQGLSMAADLLQRIADSPETGDLARGTVRDARERVQGLMTP